MGRRVAVHTHIGGRAFAPGDEVPDDLAARAKNPAIWEKGSELEPTAPAGGGEDTRTPPPRAGKGSSREAWAQFAAGHGVELGPDAGRDDYVAELERRGVIEPGE